MGQSDFMTKNLLTAMIPLILITAPIVLWSDDLNRPIRTTQTGRILNTNTIIFLQCLKIIFFNELNNSYRIHWNNIMVLLSAWVYQLHEFVTINNSEPFILSISIWYSKCTKAYIAQWALKNPIFHIWIHNCSIYLFVLDET